MNALNIYTELDSLFDTRKAVLESLLPKGETWEGVYEKQYGERRLDFFEKKELGILQEHYIEAYRKRDLGLFTSIRPSYVLSKMLTLVLDSEQLVGKPIALNVINITVNTYPYELDDDLKIELEQNISNALIFKHTVTLVYKKPETLDARYFKNFDNVFKYDILLGEDSKTFIESISSCPIKDTKFFVPDLYVKKPDSGILWTPDKMIENFSILLGPALTLLAIKHSVYDYVK